MEYFYLLRLSNHCVVERKTMRARETANDHRKTVFSTDNRDVVQMNSQCLDSVLQVSASSSQTKIQAWNGKIDRESYSWLMNSQVLADGESVLFV